MTQYEELYLTNKQARACERALFNVQQHFEHCDTLRYKWEEEAIFRLRGLLITAIHEREEAAAPAVPR